MKAIRIYVAKCLKCQEEFQFIPMKVNSVKSRNSDVTGIARCPTCNSIQNTVEVGEFIPKTWEIKQGSHLNGH
jgi:Zn finger protein HypA/HybF involved in hydrogenase expression